MNGIQPRITNGYAPPRPKFGNGGPSLLPLSPMARMFGFFETTYEPGFNLLSKIIANAIPRVAITRNKSERQEVLFNEVTQGSLLFLALPITSILAEPLQAMFSGLSARLIRMRNSEALAEATEKGGELLANKLKIAKLGKSLGASAFIASLLIAITYLRNYRTIKRTGFSDYKQVVGLGGAGKQPTAEDKIKAEQAMRKNVKKIEWLAAGGAAAWLAIMGGAGLLARRGTGLVKNTALLDKLMKHWAFVGKNSNQINGPFRSQWQTLFVWGIPSYLGWFLGCRDKYELIEQSSKFATFLAGYFYMPKLVRKILSRKNKALLEEGAKYGEMTYTNISKNVAAKAPELAKKLIGYKNRQWALLTGLNFLVAGVLPLVFNIIFSKWRHIREQKAEAQGHPAVAQAQPQPVFQPSGQLQHKTFAQWGHS